MSRPYRYGNSFVRYKTYCLRCETPNNCKCDDKSMNFLHNDKLRVPLTTSNKERFRSFLLACPTFVNLVPEELQEAFRDLLRKVKYYGKTINGRKWTMVEK